MSYRILNHAEKGLQIPNTTRRSGSNNIGNKFTPHQKQFGCMNTYTNYLVIANNTQWIQSFDLMCFSETMNSKELNVLYDGFEVVSVSGLKFHKNRRASGGCMLHIKGNYFSS